MSPTETPEIREIEPNCGYGVSADGRAWSRRGKRRLFGRNGTESVLLDTWKPLKLVRGNHNARMLNARINGKQRLFQVHRLVLSLFVGPCPEGMECCHNDGDRTNNRVENLRWDTHRNNIADKRRHGTHQAGSKHGMAKLTEAQVLEIRRRFAAGEGSTTLALAFGVTWRHILDIVKRDRWRHI